jgi:hypothetical protein
MKDFMSTNEEEVRGSTLNVKTYPLSTILEEDLDTMMQEAHYAHTINDVVELMIEYGQLKVLMDITTAIGWKKTS